MIEKYYEEELRYLYESGKEFARAFPDRARLLNIDAVGDRDPYVERLFEGFAFLAARVREKIDDSFPELTEGLFDLMWPELLQEIPSLAIAEFRPRKGMLQETRVIARGAEILSGAVGAELAVCRFTTTHDVKVSPVALGGVEKTVDPLGRATLHLRLDLEPSVQWEKLSLSPLRLYLHAETPTAFVLYEHLTSRAIAASISVDNGRFTVAVDPAQAAQPGGLMPQESLLPRDTRTFWGFALLREYFAYAEKFLFVDLHGFEKIPRLTPEPQSITFSITFDRDLPADRPFRTDNFRLFCCPIANVFRRDAEPCIHTGLRSEHRVVADSSSPASFQTHSIVSVTGVDRTTGERYDYEPFNTFRNIGAKGRRTYTTQYRVGPDNRRHCVLSLGGQQLTGDTLPEESIALQIFCTNGALPREEIREGGISRPGAGFPDFVMVANITRPTLPCAPPADEEYLWRMLAHLGATFTTLASADTLRSLLRLYDWSRNEGKARKIDAVTDASVTSVETVVNGSIVRGIEFTVNVQESEFKEAGDLHLFGIVLKEFLAHYVSINSFVELVLTLQPSAVSRRYSSLKGKQWLV